MSRSEGWCFTVNNYSNEDYEQAKNLCKIYTYGIIGKEIAPTTGTPHLQCYVYEKNKVSFSTVTACVPRGRFIQAKGSPQQNFIYCSKEGNFEEFGERPCQGRRTDFDSFRDAIWSGLSEEELLIEWAPMMAKYDRFYQRCRNVLLKKTAKKIEAPIVTAIIGEPGTGKTRYVYDNHDNDEIYKLECGDGSSNSIFWDGYNGESIILIDDFHNNFKLDYMLRLFDRYPMKLNIKGGYTYRCAKQIFITSNLTIDEWYPNCKPRHRKAVTRRITNIIMT